MCDGLFAGRRSNSPSAELPCTSTPLSSCGLQQCYVRLCRPPQELHFAAKPPLPDGSGGVAIPRQHSLQSSNPFSGSNFHLARSCPKPIVMKAKSRQPSFQQEDDLDLFIPPHELAASSLMDPANVSKTGAASAAL